MLTDKIRQKKIDAICARILHQSALSLLRGLSLCGDLLGLAVPIGYFALRFLAKGTAAEKSVEVGWECIAAALLILSVVKLVFQWADKAAQHSKLIGENISLATQAEHLLSKATPPTEDAAHSFFLFADAIEKSDRDSLGTPSDRAKHKAYRGALMEMGTDTRCPICNASPWRYTPGSCQACGNKPEK